MMYAQILVLATVAAAALAIVLTPIVRGLAIHFHLVDLPDCHRKFHGRAVAHIGGVPVLLSYVGAILILVVNSPQIAELQPVVSTVSSFLPAAFLMFLIGLTDDIFGLKPWQKLAGEGLAAALAISAGIKITGLFGFGIHPVLGAAVTLVWLVGCTNALNLIDGLDGLAAGIALLAAATMFVAALLNGQSGLAIATIPLVGALLGFLIYNFNPASIFLGDCGSLTLGFLLGCFGIAWSEKSATIFGVTAPLIALAVPLLDTTLAIIRRFLRQQPIFGADRSHIHHRLLNRGFTPRRVALLLYAAAGMAGVLSLLLSRARGHWEGAVIALFVISAMAGIHQLNYIEFAAAKRLALAGSFRRLLNAHISLEAFTKQLEGASSADQCWDVIRASYPTFGFSQVEMRVGDRCYFDGDPCRNSQPSWHMRIPLDNIGFIAMERAENASVQATLSACFADTIRVTLTSKLRADLAFQPITYLAGRELFLTK